ncbi:thioredoxin family protein [Sediminibacillus albus]|uniref:Thioredoxin n=1 Tax=Sediminibacillus albus TaxID=407036 RepID=A0A1G8Z094_9BACI|nr:thioredoxin family protein [Sediminibacillus albus]SDK08451.1 Thioredoxin [Sediminibacillus albus]
MALQAWFEKGMNPDEYIESMEKHKENLLHVYDNFILPDDSQLFSKLKAEKLRVIVLTEDWCGDAMMNTPILFHIAQKTNMEVSLLQRDNHLELMDHYLTNGKSRSIPIFIFINEKGNEVTKWGPRAPIVQSFIDDSLANLPSQDAEDFKEKRNELFTFVMKSFRDNTDFWKHTYESIVDTLKKQL